MARGPALAYALAASAARLPRSPRRCGQQPTIEESDVMKTPANYRPLVLGLACATFSAAAVAAPMTYEMDSNHTYPSFEADHMGGLSKWRGKVNSSHGKIMLDKENQSGSVDVTMDMKTIDFGNDGLNEHAQTPDLFDTAKYPTAHYTGKLVKWQDGAPTAVDGELTLHGVTKPVMLTISSFKCIPSPQQKGKERCGATAMTQLQRDDFGVDFGKAFGFEMGVTLRISTEAVSAEMVSAN
jgi:polyisoprenoid-binding protein YceI